MITDTVCFEIPGRPVPKERPRVENGHARTPERTADYETLVATLAKSAIAAYSKKQQRPIALPLTGPIGVILKFLYPWPKGKSHKDEPAAYYSRPDGDNLEKSVLDGLTKSGIWKDDCQVFDMHWTKSRTEDSNAPLAIIELWFPYG